MTAGRGGALSIGPFEVTRSRGGRGSYGNCFWVWYFCAVVLRASRALDQARERHGCASTCSNGHSIVRILRFST